MLNYLLGLKDFLWGGDLDEKIVHTALGVFIVASAVAIMVSAYYLVSPTHNVSSTYESKHNIEALVK